MFTRITIIVCNQKTIFATMHPKDLSINNYTFQLPEEKIAKYPLPDRDASKLLIYKNGIIEVDNYSQLHEHIPENSLLVFNNTKVVAARLLFTKSSGSTIEIFCLEPDERYADITTAMMQKEKVIWKCLVGGAKKWKEKKLIKVINNDGIQIQLVATIVEKKNDYFLIELNWGNTSITFSELLYYAGVIPLPPYLNRSTEEKDAISYQTIYAKHDGSVAAPTAGLHFTENVFSNLSKKNITTAYVTLHVGAGTFKPVKAETMQDHEMHAEFINVDIATIEQLLNYSNKKIVAVGTTSLRTIESLYWMGVKISSISADSLDKITIDKISINQWDAYELPQDNDVIMAFNTLLKWMMANNLKRIITKTQIIIAPTYELRVASGLVTNFHQPQSTLLLLVASIVGDDWQKIYNYALENDFRFLSYGDGSLLWNS